MNCEGYSVERVARRLEIAAGDGRRSPCGGGIDWICVRAAEGERGRSGAQEKAAPESHRKNCGRAGGGAVAARSAGGRRAPRIAGSEGEGKAAGGQRAAANGFVQLLDFGSDVSDGTGYYRAGEPGAV